MSIAIVTAASHSLVQGVIQARAIATAISIATEDPGTAEHTARLALATRILRGEVSLLTLSLAVLANTTIEGRIEAAPNDPVSALVNSEMDFQLASIWTILGLAGV